MFPDSSTGSDCSNTSTIDPTDGWPSYANIDQLGHGIYMHSLIVHQRHFVDPADADVHTEQTETATPIWHVSRFVSILSARVCFPQQVPRSGHVSHHPEDNCWELFTLTYFFRTFWLLCIFLYNVCVLVILLDLFELNFSAGAWFTKYLTIYHKVIFSLS